MMKGSKLATASEEKRRKKKCGRCGLTEQEMDAVLLLIQLCGGDSSSSSSSSVSAYHEETAAKGGCRSRSELEQGKENDSTVIQNNHPPKDYYSKSTKLRKFRSIVDLYQSTAPLRNNNNLHGKRISSSLLLSFGSDKNPREEEEEERRSDLISDAGSVIIMEMRDDDYEDEDDEMETTTTMRWKQRTIRWKRRRRATETEYELIHTGSCNDGGGGGGATEEEKKRWQQKIHQGWCGKISKISLKMKEVSRFLNMNKIIILYALDPACQDYWFMLLHLQNYFTSK